MDSSTGPLTAVPATTQRKRGRAPKRKRNADTQLPPQPDAGQNANPVCLSLGPGGEPAKPPATRRGPARPRRSPNPKSELAFAPSATQRKRGRPPKRKRNADTQLPPQPDAGQNANPVCLSLGPGGEPAKPPATRRGPARPRRSPNPISELAFAPSGPSAPETITASTGPAVSSRGRGRLKKNAASPQAVGAARRSGRRPKKMKAQLMKTTKGGENRCPRVDKASTSFDSTVMGESEKMKAPQIMHVQRNQSRRHAPRSSHIKKSPFQPSTGYNSRAKCAPEKSDRTQTFTPRLDIEDVRRHITYRLNQEESQVVERWSCHSFGTTEGDDTRFGATSTQDSGLSAIDIQCLVYRGHRDLRKLWLNNDVVHFYGETLMQWACRCPDKEYNDFFISPYAGVIALARWNDGDDLRWVKGLMKGHHNRLFFPCVINNHYILAVADCLKQKVVVYNSMNSARHKRDAVKVGNWLRRICATVLGYDDSHSWDFVYPKDIPQQVNGHDCGVFVLTYMASIIMCGSIVPFSSEEISGIRHRVLVELSKGQLVAERTLFNGKTYTRRLRKTKEAQTREHEAF
ncbi:hypothetical protein K1719_037384 [Acacia pycnantha]|nr:hypothetical protein K1719_037384 [Acacia pycnantha]